MSRSLESRHRPAVLLYMSRSSKPRRDLYQEITDRVIHALKTDKIAPWQRPWTAAPGSGTAVPHNPVTGTYYRGINVILTLLTTWERGYSSHAWLTFKGANEIAARAHRAAGRKVEQSKPRGKRGSKVWIFADGPDKGRSVGGVAKGQNAAAGMGGTMILFWKKTTYAEQDEETGEEKTRSSMIARSFNVFNAEQCDPIVQQYLADRSNGTEPEPAEAFEPIDRAEAVIAGLDVPVTHGGDRAFYAPPHDRIQLPPREAFDTPAAYYCTRFHEMTHATGHVSRLNRDGVAKFDYHGSHRYSEEELVAEFGACFLAAHCRIDRETEPASVSYLNHWASKLRDDPRIIVYAAQRAQQAADYILGRHFSQRETEETEQAA